MARIRKNQGDTHLLNIRGGALCIWRIGAYIRLSREDTRHADEERDQSESIINQQKIIIEYLERHFDGQYKIVDFYIDDGLTGTDDTRESFMRMMSDIERKQLDCVICKTLARAFRNYADQGYYLEEVFLKRNIRFISIGDPGLDTFKNPEALTGLEVPITGIMNDRFAAKTSNDVRRTFDTKRRKGEFIGAFAPYGYLKDPLNKNQLVIDEEIAGLKRDMRNWIVHDAMSLAGVAKRLNELGIPNPTAYKHQCGWNYNNPHTKTNDGLWQGAAVKRVLLAKVNLGHMEQGKQRVVSYKVHTEVRVPENEWFLVLNTHEPTFTQEEYDELAGILHRDTRTPNGMKTLHLFSGFLRCADCQKAMHRCCVRQKYFYYVCRTYKDKSKEKCAKHTISVKLLEQAVLASIQMQIGFVEQMAQRLERVNIHSTAQAQPSRIESLLKARRQELMKINNAQGSLYVDWKAEEIGTEAYRFMKEKFENQVKQLTGIIANLEEEKRSSQNGMAAENPLFDAFLKHQNIDKLDRGTLIALVDTIYVHEDRKITVAFKHRDQYRRVLAFIEANAGEIEAI